MSTTHPAPGIGLQLYTLRDLLKTPRQIAETLKKVRQIGFTAVELAGLGPIEPAELARILAGEGLTCCGAHVPMEKLRADLPRVIADHQLWTCDTLAVPGCWGKTLADFENFASEFNSAAERLAAAGMSLGYHNHSHELVRHDGRTPLSLLLEKLSPGAWFEMDTYWLVHGGADPIQWIEKVAGRSGGKAHGIPCVHLKDMAMDADGKQFMAEVGEGNLNWAGILAACRQAGVRWAVVEQDVCRRNPLESVGISFRNLTAMIESSFAKSSGVF